MHSRRVFVEFGLSGVFVCMQGCTVLLSHIPEHSRLVPYQSSLSGLLSPTARHAAVFLCASFGMFACAVSVRG